MCDLLLTNSDIVGHGLTALSILLATLLAAIGLKQNAKVAKRERTFDVMLTRFTGDYIAELHKIAWEWMEQDKPPPDGSTRNTEITEILNLYEFASFAAREGILDESVILEVRASSMSKLFHYFKPFIDARRKASNSDRPYEHLEWFVNNKARPASESG